MSMFLDLMGGINQGLKEFGAEQKAEEERQLKLSGERQRQELLGSQESRTKELHPLKKRELATKVTVGEAQGNVAISQAGIDLNKLGLQSKVYNSEDGQQMLTDIFSNTLTAEDHQAYINKIKLGTEADSIEDLAQQRVDVEKLLLDMKGADPKVAKQLREIQDVTNKASIKKVKESMMSLKEKMEAKGAEVTWDMEKMFNKMEQSLVLASYMPAPTGADRLRSSSTQTSLKTIEDNRKQNIESIGKILQGFETMQKVNESLDNPRDMAKVGEMLSTLGSQYEALINAEDATSANSAMKVMGSGLTYHLDLLNQEISKGSKIDDAFAALTYPVGIRADRVTSDAVIDPEDKAGVGANLPAKPTPEQQAMADEEVKTRQEQEKKAAIDADASSIIENPWSIKKRGGYQFGPAVDMLKSIAEDSNISVPISAYERLEKVARKYLADNNIPEPPEKEQLQTALEFALEENVDYRTMNERSGRGRTKTQVGVVR